MYWTSTRAKAGQMLWNFPLRFSGGKTIRGKIHLQHKGEEMSRRSESVTINSVPVRVVSWGGCLPSDFEKNPQSKPSELILVVPGNPGILSFYYDFLSRLHEKTKKCVWIVSHGGHEKNAGRNPPLRGNEALYDLRAQIEQKKLFIETYLSGVRLTCIGHSIGCKMLLEALKASNEVNASVDKCYFLFPTIERMAESPNGKTLTFFYRYLLWLILIGCHIFVSLPRFLQIILLRCHFFVTGIPSENTAAALDLIDPEVVHRVLFLADDEMVKVRELDHANITNMRKKIKLYYGESDGWVPLTYFEELKKKHEGIDAEVCTKGIPHAFVLKDSTRMADVVSEWMMT